MSGTDAAKRMVVPSSLHMASLEKNPNFVHLMVKSVA